MRRRDFLVNHTFEKGFIEDVMKSFAWTTLCGAAFAMGIASVKAGQILYGSAILLVFVVLTTMAIFYVAMHVVIPLDSAMFPSDPYWNEKAKSLQGGRRLVEVIKVLVTRKGIFYFVLCMSYFIYAYQVAIFLAIRG